MMNSPCDAPLKALRDALVPYALVGLITFGTMVCAHIFSPTLLTQRLTAGGFRWAGNEALLDPRTARLSQSSKGCY